jgi:hypothetical protein
MPQFERDSQRRTIKCCYLGPKPGAIGPKTAFFGPAAAAWNSILAFGVTVRAFRRPSIINLDYGSQLAAQ